MISQGALPTELQAGYRPGWTRTSDHLLKRHEYVCSVHQGTASGLTGGTRTRQRTPDRSGILLELPAHHHLFILPGATRRWGDAPCSRFMPQPPPSGAPVRGVRYATRPAAASRSANAWAADGPAQVGGAVHQHPLKSPPPRPQPVEPRRGRLQESNLCDSDTPSLDMYALNVRAQAHQPPKRWQCINPHAQVRGSDGYECESYSGRR